LYVDAATYLVSFLLILTFVPRRKAAPAAATGEEHGVLAGLRFLLHDRLLLPLAVTVVCFGFVTAGLAAGLPVYAFDEFDGSSRIGGFFYAAVGAGAIVGSIVAVAVVRKVPPLRLSGIAILCFVVPIWVMPFLPPAPIVATALFVANMFIPLVNGPAIAVVTARTPEHLRAKVMTAVIAVSSVSVPIGFLAAGQVLEHWGLVPLFSIVAAGITVMALVYSSIALRYRDLDPAPSGLPAQA